MRRKTAVLVLVLMSSFFRSGLYAADGVPEPYVPGSFPQWAYDLRRTEVITFGSLPLVTIGVSLAYGGILYANGTLSSFPNPLNSASGSFTREQQVAVLGISLAASAVLGLTDLGITLIRRHNRSARLRKIQQGRNRPYVTPVFPDEADIVSPPKEDGSAGTEADNADIDVNPPALPDSEMLSLLPFPPVVLHGLENLNAGI